MRPSEWLYVPQLSIYRTVAVAGCHLVSCCIAVRSRDSTLLLRVLRNAELARSPTSPATAGRGPFSSCRTLQVAEEISICFQRTSRSPTPFAAPPPPSQAIRPAPELGQGGALSHGALATASSAAAPSWPCPAAVPSAPCALCAPQSPTLNPALLVFLPGSGARAGPRTLRPRRAPLLAASPPQACLPRLRKRTRIQGGVFRGDAASGWGV